MWESQKGLCALTGIPLRLPQEKAKTHYAAPSIDRIDCKQGYDLGNVRIICFGMNCCLHDFGEVFFRGLAENVLGRTSARPKWHGTLRGDLTPKQQQNVNYHSTFTGTVNCLHRSARIHAKARAVPFLLTKEFIHELLLKRTTCTLSGNSFDFQTGFGQVNPLRPSLDRIDSNLGYEPANVRLVCAAVNFALNEFGEDIFRMLCEAVLSP